VCARDDESCRRLCAILLNIRLIVVPNTIVILIIPGSSSQYLYLCFMVARIDFGVSSGEDETTGGGTQYY